MERHKEVKVFKVEEICICGGVMENTGSIVTDSRQKYLSDLYEHSCNKCFTREYFNFVYPRIHYEEIEENVKSKKLNEALC